MTASASLAHPQPLRTAKKRIRSFSTLPRVQQQQQQQREAEGTPGSPPPVPLPPLPLSPSAAGALGSRVRSCSAAMEPVWSAKLLAQQQRPHSHSSAARRQLGGPPLSASEGSLRGRAQAPLPPPLELSRVTLTSSPIELGAKCATWRAASPAVSSSSSTMSPPRSPVSPRCAPGSLSSSAGSPGLQSPTSPLAYVSEPSIVCRICEQSVRVSIAEAHTRVCEQINREDMKVVAADERVAEMQRRLEGVVEAQRGQQHHNCVETLLRVAGQCRTSESVLDLIRISVLLKSLARPCQLIARLVDELSAHVGDKIAALDRCAEIRQMSPRELTTHAPFFFRTVSLTPSESPNLLTPGSLRRSSSSTPTSPRLALSMQDFEVIKPLTRGGFGSVYVARKVQTGDVFAIKVMKRSLLSHKNAMALQNERDILVDTENEYVVQMYYCFASEDNVYIVMEYLPGGDCFSMLQTLGRFTEQTATAYIAETVLALEYLHSKGIVHRDLKPDNMLIDKTGHIKLTDFGLSHKGLMRKQARSGPFQAPSECACPVAQAFEQLDGQQPPPLSLEHSNGKDSSARVLGTPDYIAPEVLLGLPHGEEVDWWALGCVMFEFLTGTTPFAGDTVDETFDNIIGRRIQWLEDAEVSPQARDFVTRLLELDTEKRLGGGGRGAEEVRSHALFERIDWATLRKQSPPFVPRIASDDDTEFFKPRLEVYGDPTSLASAPKSKSEGSVARGSVERMPQADTFLWVNFGHLAGRNREIISGQAETGGYLPPSVLTPPNLHLDPKP
eukprot:m51a1_g13121 putative protein kinase (784) ;mRNA; r:272-2763